MKRQPRGFVLLELIVALTILGIGFAVAFAGISQSTRNIDKLQRIQQRENEVRNLLAQLDLAHQLCASPCVSSGMPKRNPNEDNRDLQNHGSESRSRARTLQQQLAELQ